MYVCLCRAVTDHEVVDAIRDGARTTDDISERCDEAGTVCGGCVRLIEELLHGANGRTEARAGARHEPRD